MESKRTFIAIDISFAAREACARHVEALRSKFPDVRVGWEKPEKLHITLKFLGATGRSVLPRLEEALAKVAGRHTSFALRLSTAGVFPSRSKPRILWVGVSDESTTTAALFTDIEQACVDLGFERERRDYRPHITIGRIREPQTAAALAAEHVKTSIEQVEFEVKGIVLYESKLGAAGSTYSALMKAKL